MPLIACPDCGREISDAAPTCPHCGLASFQDRSAREQGGPSLAAKVTIGSLAGLGLLAVVGYLSGPASPSPLTAFVDCKNFVERRLRAPATAAFADFEGQRVQDLGGDRFRVTSWVDAENAFGAKLRTIYGCTVRYEGETVHLEALTGL